MFIQIISSLFMQANGEWVINHLLHSFGLLINASVIQTPIISFLSFSNPFVMCLVMGKQPCLGIKGMIFCDLTVDPNLSRFQC